MIKLKIINKLNTKLSKVLMYLSLILTIVVVYGVLVRYFVGRADARVIFVSVWLYGSLFVLGGGYTLLEGGHVSVDIIYKKLSQKARKALDIINYILIIACCLIIIYVSLPLAYQSFVQREVDSSLGVVFAPPIWWFKWIPVIGIILILLQAISLMKEVSIK
ncbi:MAG: TRAP transporter small permease subunit [Synergistetes bacterium]|nr:TRAP transporter small permease subunit [Synergistota bacterium]MDW8192849.1 TRAP transporter small permease subunit [Synergistota bacterium]